MVQRGRPPPLQQCHYCCSPGPPCPLGFVWGRCVLLGTPPGRLCLSTSCLPQAHSIYSVPSVYGLPHHSARQNVPPFPKLRSPHLAVACAGATLLAWTLPCALTALPFHLLAPPPALSLAVLSSTKPPRPCKPPPSPPHPRPTGVCVRYHLWFPPAACAVPIPAWTQGCARLWVPSEQALALPYGRVFVKGGQESRKMSPPPRPPASLGSSIRTNPL